MPLDWTVGFSSIMYGRVLEIEGAGSVLAHRATTREANRRFRPCLFVSIFFAYEIYYPIQIGLSGGSVPNAQIMKNAHWTDGKMFSLLIK